MDQGIGIQMTELTKESKENVSVDRKHQFKNWNYYTEKKDLIG
jgi:hypothetical protein